MSAKILIYAEKLIKNENHYIVKSAFLNSNTGVNVDEIITISKNSKEEIISVDFKMQNCNTILNNVISKIDNNLIGMNDNYILEIPIGFMANSPLILNLGPKIPLKVLLTDAVLGNVRTNVKSFGINNALVEVYIDLYFKVETFLPLSIHNQDFVYETLIASKVVSGKVPEFLGGKINEESQILALPITQ